MKKRIKILFLTLLLSVSFLAVGNLVLAQEVDVTGLGVVDEGIALGATDPRIVAARIIQIALGFLGIIAVGLIIYGGWMYMTSEGNEEKITKAKNILKAAVIGLIIILSAFGIASFVISRLLGATGVTTGDRCIDGAERSCGCGGIQVCSGESWGACVGSSCDIMGGINFFIRSTNPRDNETNAIRNVKISAFLNRSLGNVEDLADNFKVEKIGEISEESGDPIDFGPVEINGSISAGLDDSVIYFQADSSCEFLGQTIENCLDAWSRFRVTINESRNLIDANRQKLNEGAPYIFEFNTKSDIDIGDPIAGIVPTQICVDDGSLKPDANLISGWARDDYGLNSLVFYQAKIGEDFALEYYNSAEGVKFYSTRHKYDTSNMIAGDEYIFRVEAEDVAGQYGRADFQTIVRPGHCCNGIQDGNEEDVDCGGSCLSCVGGPCNVSEPNQCGEGASNCSDNLCSTFFCDCKGADGCICERKPIIDWISPSGGFCENNKDQPCQSDDDCGANGPCDQSTPNAKNGNLVSIGGRNFGTYDSDSSKVYFGNAEAKLASSVNDKCDNSWTDRQIIVVVPAGIASSSIMVEGSNGFSDSTGDNYGAPIPDFVVTGFDRPGLCKLNPSEGAQDDRITYYGLGLTESSAFFGSRSSNLVGTNQNNVSNQEISALVPSIRNGLTSSFVKTKIGDVDVESNYLDFTKKPSTSGPQIFSFDPVIGNVGQYVTIRGKGFGANQGNSTVSFGDNGADYNFPLVCATSLWSDKQVIVKVPEGISDGDYLIEMNVGNNTIDSSLLNPAKFKASSTLPLAPGICKIDPKSGLFGKAVSLWGEYFGSAQGDVKFSNNKDSDSISFWNKDSSVTTGLQPDKAIASVPQGAQSGPVQVISSDNRESNKMDFLVGSCLQADDPDDVCGDGVCCPAGTFAEGECKADNDDCYFTPKNSVYEFEFSTGKETTSNGGGPDDNGGNNFSCSGYGDACSSNYLCPNSPGRCSPYEGGVVETGADCDRGGSNIPGCENGDCVYIESLDRFASSTQECQLKIGYEVKDINNNVVSPTCRFDSTSNAYRWTFNTPASCPIGWSRGAGNVCVKTGADGVCSVCSENFRCVEQEEGADMCVSNTEACSGSAYCGNDGKCVIERLETCDCCCEKGEDARDCCAGMTCAGTCGAGSVDLTGDGTNETSFGECTGCTIKVGGVINQNASDLACNCTGHSGKYCDTEAADGLGVCKDCTQISTQSECSKHSTCCVDARRDNVCRGSVGTEKISENNINYCPYYKCEGDNCAPSKAGDYTSSDCNDMCGSTSLGEPCYDKEAGVCNLRCTNPYNCLGFSGCEGGECEPGDNSCLCCCDPKAEIEPCLNGLECQPDKDPCTGADRGLCCGCSSDNQCGSLESVGCGSDTCCRSRPGVASVKPANGVNNVCRNAQISATFDSLMDVSSFSGNVIVVGDYGFGQCPGDTQYLVLDGQEHKPRNIFARTYLRIKKSVQATIAFILSPIRSEQAYADNSPSPDHNYCAIRGAVSGIHNTVAATSTLVFSPNQLLDPGRDYFVIIKGDTELDSKQGVRSDYKVGMNGTHSATFNGINFSNAYIWKFTTLPDQGPLNSGICEVERVEISPSSYLFKTNLNDLHENDTDPGDDSFDKVADKDKVFTAMAMSSDNQVLVPVGGYMWDWGWRIENNQVVATSSVFDDNAERQFVKVETTLVDAKTKLFAEAKFKIENQIFSENKTGEANVYVFLCENPWPTPTSDEWSPWRDTDQNCIGGDCLDTNFELYYCRDAGGHGTADDLPALAGESVVRGSSDGIIKEAYLFRAGVPVVGYGSDTPFLSGLVKPQGKTVSLSWNKVNSILKYKIYYGRNSRAYTNSILVELSANDPEQVAYEVSNLDNGIDYYFAVTAISDEGAESKYSNEIKLKPWDSMGPVMPTLSSLTRENNNVKIEWSWSDTSNPDDAKTFRLHYRFGGQCNEDTVFPAFKEIQKNETVLLDISNLEDNVSVCVGLNAYDQYGNPSDTIIEQWPLIEETPDEDSAEDENAENNDEASE